MALKVRLLRSYHCSRWWVDETGSPQLCDSNDVFKMALDDWDYERQEWSRVDDCDDMGFCTSCASAGRDKKTKLVEKITRVVGEG